MGRIMLCWKRFMAWPVVFGLLMTGLIFGCGRTGGGSGSSAGTVTATPAVPSGTGTVVITGRIL